jgi:hypothetical protein
MSGKTGHQRILTRISGKHFDKLLVLFIITVLSFGVFIGKHQVQRSSEIFVTSQDKPIGLALIVDQQSGYNKRIKLNVSQTYNNNTATFRGILIRLKLSNPNITSVDEASMRWGESFQNVQGVKYATYDQNTGNLNIAVASSNDTQVSPGSTILQFDVQASQNGTFSLGFDPSFETLDVVGANNQSLLDKTSLNTLSLIFSSGTGGTNTTANSITLGLTTDSPASIPLGQDRKIVLRVTNTLNGIAIPIQGMIMRLKVSDPSKLIIKNNELTWGQTLLTLVE